MSWLDGLGTISGPRWSAGAYWAEDGNAQPDDSDWADSSTWGAAHAYDPDAQLSLGVFVNGDDVTALVRGASWGLGQMELMPSSVQPSSGSLELKGALGYVAGDRVVILTETDVLYVASVAMTTETTDTERVETSLALEDELARVALEDWPAGETLGTSFDRMMDEMMRLAGITTPWAGVPEMAFPFGQFQAPDIERSGTILAVLGELIRQSLSMAAWTPQGVRVITTDLLYLDETDRGWADVDVTDLDGFYSCSITRDPSRVRNEVTTTYGGSSTYTASFPDSIEAYGGRALPEYDVEDWGQQSNAINGYLETILEGDDPTTEAAYVVPLPTIAGQARIGSRRHRLTRLLPFDHVTDGDPTLVGTTERYRVLRIAHRLTPDAWGVTIEGVLVRRNTAY